MGRAVRSGKSESCEQQSAQCQYDGATYEQATVEEAHAGASICYMAYTPTFENGPAILVGLDVTRGSEEAAI